MGRFQRELGVAITAVRDAAATIAAYYAEASISIYTKHDASPVTDADLASDQILRKHLMAAFPDDAILTEEGVDDLARLSSPRVWIADPLDGTQQFIDRSGEFEVFLALVIDGRPVVAVAGHPVTGTLLSAVAGEGATIEDDAGKRPLRVAPLDRNNQIQLGANRYHTLQRDWPTLVRIATAAGVTPPTSPLPFTPRAFFEIDGRPPVYEAYLGLGPLPGDPSVGSDWDMAAPDLLLHEAGGVLTDDRGELIHYNKPEVELRHGVIAVTDRSIHQRLLDQVARERPPLVH
jgi:3'-phosphoadenosine 5'-phosphosulfate (PAPS) 3'-phosphatase